MKKIVQEEVVGVLRNGHEQQQKWQGENKICRYSPSNIATMSTIYYDDDVKNLNNLFHSIRKKTTRHTFVPSLTSGSHLKRKRPRKNKTKIITDFYGRIIEKFVFAEKL